MNKQKYDKLIAKFKRKACTNEYGTSREFKIGYVTALMDNKLITIEQHNELKSLIDKPIREF